MKEFITPSRKEPVFTAYNDYLGNIETGKYKNYEVRVGKDLLGGSTFGTNYKTAVNDLHDFIIENKEMLKDYPKSTFAIEMINGSFDRYDLKRLKVYSISAKKAKRFLL